MRKYTLHWSLRPDRDEKWYRWMRPRVTDDGWARDFEINYTGSVAGKVFATYRAERHNSLKPLEVNPSLPVYRVWDFGKTNATLYAQIDSHGRKRFHLLRILTESNTTEQLAVVERDSFDYFPSADFVDIGDPAGQWTSDFDLLAKSRIYPSCAKIEELAPRKRTETGIKLILKDLQETPGGEESFKMFSNDDPNDGCYWLRKAFEGGYHYKKDSSGSIGDKIVQRHPYEDAVDCLKYLYLETYGGFWGDEVERFAPVYGGDANPVTGY